MLWCHEIFVKSQSLVSLHVPVVVIKSQVLIKVTLPCSLFSYGNVRNSKFRIFFTSLLHPGLPCSKGFVVQFRHLKSFRQLGPED